MSHKPNSNLHRPHAQHTTPGASGVPYLHSRTLPFVSWDSAVVTSDITVTVTVTVAVAVTRSGCGQEWAGVGEHMLANKRDSQINEWTSRRYHGMTMAMAKAATKIMKEEDGNNAAMRAWVESAHPTAAVLGKIDMQVMGHTSRVMGHESWFTSDE